MSDFFEAYVEDIKDSRSYIRYGLEALFIATCIYFIVRVNALNKTLKSFYPEHNKPNVIEAQAIIWAYPADVLGGFVIGLVLVFVSLYLGYNFISRSLSYNSLSLFVLFILSLFVNIWFDFKIYQALNNPILQIIYLILIGSVSIGIFSWLQNR